MFGSRGQKAGARFSKVPKTLRTQKAIRKTPPRLFREAGIFIRCKGNKNLNNCKISCLEMPLFWRYKENYVTWNVREKFRDFWETGSRGVNDDIFEYQTKELDEYLSRFFAEIRENDDLKNTFIELFRVVCLLWFELSGFHKNCRSFFFSLS